jgi:hypothetical protein
MPMKLFSIKKLTPRFAWWRDVVLVIVSTIQVTNTGYYLKHNKPPWAHNPFGFFGAYALGFFAMFIIAGSAFILVEVVKGGRRDDEENCTDLTPGTIRWVFSTALVIAIMLRLYF